MKQVYSRALGSVAAALSLIAMLQPASAETLRVPDHIPSGNPDFLTIQSIALGAFQGDDGNALSHVVEARLAGFRGEDGPFFNVIVDGNGTKPDAIATGSARVSVETFRNWQKREICDEKDADKKCLRYRDVPMDCTRRIVSISTQLRFHSPSDGRVLLSDGAQRRQEKVICPDDSSSPQTVDEVADELLQASVLSLIPELAPRQGNYYVKLREETGGLAKPAVKRFRAAIKLTKTNPSAACAEFDALAGDGPQNAALAFDRAVCAEGRGDVDSALSIYNNLRSQNSNDQFASEGIRRIDKNRRALAEITARRAWVNGRSK
ncbi:hypothetical protein [Sphingorhabdus sp.]|uniref:hypothetical protein n=1 Tax=Sphingorhabdus sp. TaxID=1902408 RepID=UPI003BB10AB4